MFFDTHAHLNLKAFKNEYKDIIKNTLDAGVFFNNVGTKKETSEEAVKIANEAPQGVYAVVGLHPNNSLPHRHDPDESTDNIEEKTFDYDWYKKLAGNEKVVGIGECGLDYYRIPEGMDKEQIKEIQTQVFKDQIKLAKELNKALVIHCRPSKDSNDAYVDVIQILQESRPERLEVHSFTSNWQVCQRFLELGAYIGLNGIITFDKTGVLKEVVSNCPLEKIVLETDAPYLAPDPYRGKRNEPAYVQYVAQYIASVKNLSLENVADVTTQNAKTLFQIVV